MARMNNRTTDKKTIETKRPSKVVLLALGVILANGPKSMRYHGDGGGSTSVRRVTKAITTANLRTQESINGCHACMGGRGAHSKAMRMLLNPPQSVANVTYLSPGCGC